MTIETKGILICYRRDESAWHAGRIADRFAEHFGEYRVFYDLDLIEPGLDPVEQTRRALDSSEVVIAVINKTWLTATDEAGQKRLEDPDDHVRITIATALERNIRLIPVLVQGAPMPRPDELPDDLSTLTRRHAFELHESSWEDDIRRLVTALERVVGRREDERDVESASGEEIRRLSPTPSPPLAGQADNQATSNVAANTGGGSPSTKWGQVVLALLLPALLGIATNSYLGMAYADYAVTPSEVSGWYAFWTVWIISLLPCGFWAGLVWSGRSFRGYVLLGLAEGVLGLVVDYISEPTVGVSIFGFATPTLIFLSGALFADLRKKTNYLLVKENLGMAEQ